MKEDMRRDFDEAIHLAKVDDFSLVKPYRYESVLIDILNKFTKLGKKGLNHYWLWNDLKTPYVSASGGYGPEVIAALFDPNEEVWFIAEDWQVTKKHGCFWLYESTLGSTVKILNEMYGFEYYIVDRKMRWMVGENHHDILFGLGEYAMSNILNSNLPNKSIQPTANASAD